MNRAGRPVIKAVVSMAVGFLVGVKLSWIAAIIVRKKKGSRQEYRGEQRRQGGVYIGTWKNAANSK